eukprot:SAG25_NODE_432_length_8108_cov_357.746442_5_plen_124_part_00
MSGDQTTLRDCLFEWNDWTAVGGSWPLNVPTMGKAHRATTVWAADTEGPVLERLTFMDTCDIIQPGPNRAITPSAHSVVPDAPSTIPPAGASRRSAPPLHLPRANWRRQRRSGDRNKVSSPTV